MNFDIASLMNIFAMMNPKASTQSMDAASSSSQNIDMLSSLLSMMNNKRNDDTPVQASTTQKKNEYTSPFAQQNGIGESINLSGAGENKKAGTQSGFASGGMPDMMSMLINMLSKRTHTAQSAGNVKNEAATEKDETKEESTKKNSAVHNEDNKSQDVDRAKTSKDNIECGNIKTQPIKTDFFEPIAFAGYGMRSALNKLYFTLLYPVHKEDAHRIVR